MRELNIEEMEVVSGGASVEVGGTTYYGFGNSTYGIGWGGGVVVIRLFGVDTVIR